MMKGVGAMYKFPYGVCNFAKIITQNDFYVDRTDKIPFIEQSGKQLLFLRPRRFGKSLLISMLENYYDIATADKFEPLFGRLAIGQSPTPLHNHYLILHWDFSTVSPLGDVTDIQQALHDHLNVMIADFQRRYQSILRGDIVITSNNALASLQSLATQVQQTPYPVYLFIDEYDNFANEVLMAGGRQGQARYKALLYGEGLLKTLFKTIKASSARHGIDRVFITGVSPVVLSDTTSGYNIARNITFKPELYNACGFEEHEFADVVHHIGTDYGLSAEKITSTVAMMRAMYNGYTFGQAPSPAIYNPTLVLYFLQHFQEYGVYPRDLLDSNLAMDRGKIAYIAHLPNGADVVTHALDEQRALSVQRLAGRFGVEDVLREIKDETYMASLLYYFGMLTLDVAATARNPLRNLVLTIPNQVVRKLYFEELQDRILPVMRHDEARYVTEALYTTGEMQLLCSFIEGSYFKVFDNRDYRWANELTVKTAFLTLLFNDLFYITDSEPALQRTYADLLMMRRPDTREYQLFDLLIEFKYISLTEFGQTSTQLQKLARTALYDHALVQAKLSEGRTQLTHYRQILEQRYGDILRLRTYVIVALGFERLVWEEL